MIETAQNVELAAFDLEALKARCLNNLNLVERVLTKFTGQVDADLAELERAVAAGNAPEVAKVAHRIKGMTANIEAREMSADAGRCERIALAAATDELPAQLERLREDRNRLLDAIAKTQSVSGQWSVVSCNKTRHPDTRHQTPDTQTPRPPCKS